MRRNHGKNPRAELELKLNLPPKQVRPARGGPSTRMVVEDEDSSSSSSSSSPSPSISPPSSCVSSEEEEQKSSSPETTTSMVLAGCPQCLMYVMLSETEPKCPKCQSTLLLDFQHDKNRRN